MNNISVESHINDLEETEVTATKTFFKSKKGRNHAKEFKSIQC